MSVRRLAVLLLSRNKEPGTTPRNESSSFRRIRISRGVKQSSEEPNIPVSSSRNLEIPEPKSVAARLTERREWEALQDLLSTKDWEKKMESTETKGSFRLSRKSRRTAEQSGSEDPGALLHLMCQFSPPIYVVRQLLNRCPEAASNQDAMGRYPVHSAVRYGANPDVVRFLISKHPASAEAQDITGKSPLHLACEHYSQNYDPKRDRDIPTKEAIVTVVHCLYRAAPSTINVEDMEGLSALEYAIECGAGLRVVKDLQKASEKDWKNRRSSSEANHDTLDRNIQEPIQDRKEELRRNILEMTNASLVASKVGSTSSLPA